MSSTGGNVPENLCSVRVSFGGSDIIIVNSTGVIIIIRFSPVPTSVWQWPHWDVICISCYYFKYSPGRSQRPSHLKKLHVARNILIPMAAHFPYLYEVEDTNRSVFNQKFNGRGTKSHIPLLQSYTKGSRLNESLGKYIRECIGKYIREAEVKGKLAMEEEWDLLGGLWPGQEVTCEN